jgi:hypothetical protein
MRTFDQWLDEGAIDTTIRFIDYVCNKADEAVAAVKAHGSSWGRKGTRYAKDKMNLAAGEVGHATTHPVEMGKKAALAVPRSMWSLFKHMEVRYGFAQAIGIMAVAVGLHFAAPPLVLVPGSLAVGAAPGVAVAETWHQIRDSNSLFRQGVRGFAHLLRLDRGEKEHLTPKQIKKLGHEAYSQLLGNPVQHPAQMT